MATRVPFSGVQQVAPNFAPTQRQWVNAPAAAFGGATAQAEQGLGQAFGQTGNELFARAQAMQDLANHSEATQAVSDYMDQAGKIHANFSATQGKDAVNGFNPSVDAVKKARTDIRANLSNPMVQKMYDAESLSTQSRTIFNMAGHAAIENKNYAIGAAAARATTARNAALVDPTDEASFDQHIDDVTRATTAQWQLKGADQDTINAAVHKNVSDLYVDRITNLVKNQPYTAKKILDQAIKDGKIEGPEIGRINQIVLGAMHTVGARNISNQLVSGQDISFGDKALPIAQAKLTIGQMESSGSYASDVNSGTVHGHALGKYGIMEDNLGPWLKEAGLPSMTSAEFLKDPSAQDKVFETVFGGYMQKYGSFNEAASMWLTGKTMENAGNVADRFGTTASKYVQRANAILAKNAPLSDLVAKGRAIAQNESPNDSLLPDYVEQRIVADRNLHLEVQRNVEYQGRLDLDNAIVQGQNGKPFANIDDLIHSNPQAWDAYSRLDPLRQMQAQKDVVSYYNAQTRQSEQKTYHTLLGEAYGTPDEVNKFKNTNIYQMDLSRGDMNKFLKIQGDLIKQQGGNTQISQALKMVGPLISAAGIDTTDKNLMARFRGSYIDAIEDWHAQNPNKPLDEKTAKNLATGIMQKESSPNFWFGKDYLFNLPLPSALEDKIRTANPQVSDAQLELYRQEYVRQQFNALQKSQAAK